MLIVEIYTSGVSYSLSQDKLFIKFNNFSKYDNRYLYYKGYNRSLN